MNYHWNWAILWTMPYEEWLLEGLGLTVLITVLSFVLALLLGVLAGVASRSRFAPIGWLVTAYVQLFRNVPPLVQLFLWYFVIPDLLPDAIGLWVKRDMPYPEVTTAIFAIGLFAGARVTEQIRAGLAAVERKLLPAALATGLRPLQAFRLVLLPLALRNLLGPLTSEALVTMKLSSLSLTIGVLELTGQSRQIENATYQGFEAFAAATVGYLVIGLGVSAGARAIERRLQLSGGRA
jgi:glutamate/aspartate transport system permease protein